MGKYVYSGVGWIDLRVNGGSAEIEAMVVQEDPIEFDVLMGVDVIMTLGSISVTKSGEMHFLRKQA